MVPILERFFDLRPGDLRRGIFLALYYFLVIAAYVQGQTARDALFLDRFEAVRLPYVDFIVAAAVGGILPIYFRLGQVVSLVNLLASTLFFFAANVVCFWWLAHFRPSPWLLPVFYVWVGIFGVVPIAQVWTLANQVLTKREAKRLFGFIGSGGIAGGIAGGFASTVLAKALGAEGLLLAMAVSIVIAAVLVFVIASENRNMLRPSTAIESRRPSTLRESVRTVRSSPHLLTMACLICICGIATYIARWQFKAILKQSLPDKNAMAAFLGWFSGATGTLALAIQVFLTPRLLRHFGIRATLLVLPLALLFGTVAVIATGRYGRPSS